MRTDWDNPETAAAWADAVANDGDVFHEFILKPYIAACLSALDQDDPSCVPSIFYRNLGEAFAERSSDKLPELSHAVREVTARVLGNIKKIKILDIGGGEGFVGRWLRAHCERYTVIDVAADLVRVGAERAREVSAPAEFLRGDLNEVQNFPAFDDWLREGCQEVWRSSALKQRAKSVAEFDVVFCNNVIDHLMSPAAMLSRLSASMGGAQVRPSLVLCTLNPDFFVGAEQWPQKPHKSDGGGEARTVRMGPAARDVTVIPRGWMVVEHLLNAAKFNILSCDPVHISQYPPAVQDEFMRKADLTHKPAGGPFLMWHLSSAHQDRRLTPNELEDAIDRFEILKAMSDAQRRHLVENADRVTRITYAPDEPIAFPSNLPHGFFLVEEGEANMIVRSRQPQVFPKDTGFGELETGRDAFVSRFLYPVRAGSSGCTAIRIDKQLFSKLLEDRTHRSLGASLFDILRDRVSTYSWVYHRSTYTSRSVRPIGVADTSTRVTDRECEQLARVLLFACTMEGGTLRRSMTNVTNNNGLSVLIYLPAMREAIAGGLDAGSDDDADTDHDDGIGRKKRKKNTPYAGAIRLFHAIGAIDTFGNLPSAISGPGTAKELVQKTFVNLLYLAIEKVLFADIEARIDDVATKDLLNKLKADVFRTRDSGAVPAAPSFLGTRVPGWSVLEKQIVENVLDEGLWLANDAVFFAEALEKKFGEALRQPPDRLRMAVARFVYNLAFVRNEFINRGQPRFFVVNDMYLLRRIAVGSENWLAEVKQRATTSPYVKAERNELKIYQQARGYADEWRFHAYLSRFERFVENYWSKGLDLVHTHDAFNQEQGMVRRALDDKEINGYERVTKPRSKTTSQDKLVRP